MSNNLTIKSIGELLSYSFNIPSYQRGYRWKGAYQVKDLLEDIWSYKVDSNNENAFYCLQPVVVLPDETVEKRFDLIDGQQRLTTILLILHYLNETEFKKPKRTYSIDFETRFKQRSFLTHVDDDDYCEKNIDLFHLNRAYDFIQKWFSKNELIRSSINGEFYSKLINKVKVIWYSIVDIDENTNVIDVFTRLNIGKIRLTNAELIKALFLSRSGKELVEEGRSLKQLTIASEWDRIEQTLQQPDFWYFISNDPDKYDTRIEYIFDLIKNKRADDETFFTFLEFCKDFEGKNKETDDIWKEIKEYFLTFEEWYNEQGLYHLIGYLITAGKSIEDLIPNKENAHLRIPKSDYKKWLKKEALKTISLDKLENLNYHESKDKPEITRVLLLFNILSILDNPNSSLRFPFHDYHIQKWNIEHIRSQTDKDVNGKDRENWATTQLEYFTGLNWEDEDEKTIEKSLSTLSKIEKGFCKKVLIILKGEDKDSLVFKGLYGELKSYFKEDEGFEDIDGVSNLALLDEHTNKMYQNAFFPVKRKHIIEKNRQAVFIPLCTRNIFLKAYTKKLGDVMHWNNNDGNDYLLEIKRVLTHE